MTKPFHHEPWEQGFRTYLAEDGRRVARVIVSPGGLKTGTFKIIGDKGQEDIRPLTDREMDAVITGAFEAIAA